MSVEEQIQGHTSIFPQGERCGAGARPVYAALHGNFSEQVRVLIKPGSTDGLVGEQEDRLPDSY